MSAWPKTPGAGVAWLSKLILFLVINFLSYGAPAQSDEDTISTPKKDRALSSCTLVSKGPKIYRGEWPKEAKSVVKSFVQNVSEAKASGINHLFHPRLKLKNDFGEKFYYSLKNKYKGKWDLSLFRAWAIKNPDEFKDPVACQEDGIILTPLYGYTSQIAVWLQLMSTSELGRIFLLVVPTKGSWKIGAIHLQQWTFQGEDYASWAKRGLEAKGRDLVKSHIYFDISQKMLFGGSFIEYPIKKEILEEQEKVFNKDRWLDLIHNELGLNEIAYVGTLLPPEGPGILARFRTNMELNNETIQKKCVTAGRKFMKKGWIMEGTGGVRCDFILPKEPLNRPGILGGQYFSVEDLKNSKFR